MAQRYKQLPLITEGFNASEQVINDQSFSDNGFGNRLAPDDRAFHDWYRFVLSFPAHLVSYYLNDFGLQPGQIVLDPFCGTGTTLVEAKKLGYKSIGIEANPIAQFASSVKTDWEVDADDLLDTAINIAGRTRDELRQSGIDDDIPLNTGDISRLRLRRLSDEENKLILTNSISSLPLHKALILRDRLDCQKSSASYRHLRLALAKTIVYKISNLNFGPEVGVGKIITDAPVIRFWMHEVRKIAQDLDRVRHLQYPVSQPILADSRDLHRLITPESVDAIITSPPYPNEKDYTRTTRLESVLLGFIRTKDELRALKKTLVRSNTRGVYKDDFDDELIEGNEEIQRIADEIEKRRIEMGKTSGFERMYARVTKLYFGGMARHLIDLKEILRPGAKLAYVVGDQASYLRVMIRTGQLLASIAEHTGYQVERIDLFRTRFATATRQDLREEVVVLKWKGPNTMSAHKDNSKIYSPIIEEIFKEYYREGLSAVPFSRNDISKVAERLGINLPKNIGDLLYSFRFRKDLPESITQKAPEGKFWAIRLTGRGMYEFVLVSHLNIIPSINLAEIKIPDATPGIISNYALDDEQALLAKIRYNRLIDVFSGLTCYSLQNHLRTSVKKIGQIETDEVYIGLDKHGVQYVLPVQAKGGRDRLSVVQAEQDIAMCSEKFPDLVCRPIAAQFTEEDVIVLFELTSTPEGIRITEERHYRLVAPDEISAEELAGYRS